MVLALQIAVIANVASAQPLSPAARGVDRSIVSITVSFESYPGQLADDVSRGRLGDFLATDSNDPRDLRLIRNSGRHQFANGIVITERLILTPQHVIDGATKVFIRGPGGEGSYANIHAADSRSDLAVLELLAPIPGIQPARFAKPKRISLGDQHLVAASFGPIDRRIETGRIAAVDRKLDVPDVILFGGLTAPQPFVCYGTLVQSTAPGAKGLSGSGVFSPDGDLIGMTTALAAVAGSELTAGYVMPFDELYRPIVDVLKQGKEVEYGFLGITWGGGGFGFGRGGFRQPFGPRGMRQLAPDDPNGIVIGGVTPGMPAADAGLEPGDQLAAINGRPIMSQSELQFRVAAALAGRPTELTVRRGGQLLPPVTVRLAKAKNEMPFLASRQYPPVFGLSVDHWSIVMQDIMRNDREARSMIVPHGVVIASIEPDSPASRRFTEPNRRYIITAVDQKPVDSPDEFHDAVAGKRSVRLNVARVGDVSGRNFEVILP